MDKKYFNDSLLVERYLQGKVSPEEAESFERQFLSSDELLDELETAERLQQGLNDLSTLRHVHDKKWLPSNIISLFRSPRYAMATTLMLLISLGISSALIHRNAGLPESGLFGELPTEIIPLIATRSVSDGEPNVISLGPVPQQIILMLDPGYETFSHYRATIYRLYSGEESVRLWQVDGMVPGYEDMLALSMPNSILSMGDFEVKIEGWRDEWSPNHDFMQVGVQRFTVKK